MQSWKIQVLSYFSGIWRYRWYGLAITWAVCLAGWVGVALVPNKFESEAKVYIDTDTLMRPLMQGLTVNTNVDQQVDVMMRTLITRPNVEQVVKLTDPDIVRAGPGALQEKIDDVQKAISLKPLGAKNLFAIDYQNSNPAYAQSVTQSLVSILVNSNLGDARRDVQGVQSFIDEQVANYERQLREVEKRRADFRVANIGYLSGNGTNPSDTVDRARSAVQTAQTELDGAETRRESLLIQLQKTPPLLQVDSGAPIIINQGGGGGGGSLASQMVEAQARLDDLQSRFTDSHPDVIAAKKLIVRLKQQAAMAHASGTDTDAIPHSRQGISNPAYVNLQNRMADEETNVALQRHKLEVAKADEESVKKTMAESITVAREYADLDRDYDVMHKNYQDLLARREAARLSQAVGDQQSTMVFRIVEAPQKPQFAASPNRMLLNSTVLFFGVMAGLAGAFLLSMNASQFIVSDQLVAAFNVPIIGVVTRVRRKADVEQSRRSIMAMAASFGALVLCYVLILVVFQMNVLPKLSNLL